MESIEYWFVFQNDHLLIIKGESEQKLPTLTDVSSLKKYFLRHHMIGPHHFCAEIPSTLSPSLPLSFESISLRKALELLGRDWYKWATKAYSVINWDRNHQFCGRCGSVTQHRKGQFERVCTQCGLSLYPRISPSMIVLIKKNDQLLMARSPHFTPGAYGLIAGFVEVGESIEDAVHREVKEEVGIEIKNLVYYGSQAWPFPDSLMIGFIADYAAGEIAIDKKEIEDAGWYRYDKLPGKPSSSISIAGKLIAHFIAEQKQKGH